MSSPFSALSHHNHALAVWGPGQILDGARERLDFNLEDMLLVDGVPDPDLARLIYKHSKVIKDMDLLQIIDLHYQLRQCRTHWVNIWLH
jgi:hypothetical protein